jgi:hypothetical protein|tara:strand:- start:2220 stop:2462 length:243 start_codon:yes stop_codon:yes gene_type:complete
MKGQWEGGKGSEPRSFTSQAYRDTYDSIFVKKTALEWFEELFSIQTLSDMRDLNIAMCDDSEQMSKAVFYEKYETVIDRY